MQARESPLPRSPVTHAVRILLVEDSEDDAALVSHQLARHDREVHIERVDSLAALDAALDTPAGWDAIVSDFNLPGFSGIDALRKVRERDAEVPFFLVSATIGEDVAVEAMRAGANDYVMKNRIARLLPALQRELREAAVRREKALADARLEHLVRVRAVTQEINATLVRVTQRDDLFREVCRIAIEQGRFRDAWIEAVDPRGGPFAAGAGRGPDAPLRHEAALTALRDGREVVCNEVPGTAPASLAALPIVVEGEIRAVLGLEADEPDFFDADEMRLLREMARDIAFGLDHLDKRERLAYLAYYDSVTGLANRALFGERLGQLMQASLGRRIAVVVLDLDRFRAFNESFGRHAGDALLREVAARLARRAGTSNVARIGAGRFAVLLSGIATDSDIARLFGEVLDPCFAEPFSVEERTFALGAKSGIALHPDDSRSPADLLRYAEAAASRAKESAESYLFYAAQMSARVAAQLDIEHRLRHALDHDEFVLHYQPKFAVATGALTGAEALIRWQAPGLGLVGPARFVPALEDMGLIAEAGDWALRRALADRRRWVAEGLPAPRIAVNISARHLARRDFAERVRELVAGPPSAGGIDLEVTEGVLIDDVQGCIDKLATLRDCGMGIAIDDFGTGYSSLAYLARLPVQALKVDRSFIVSMLGDRNSMTLVSSIVKLAHALGMRAIAEGVESQEQLAALRTLGCDEVQGYLTGPPATREEFATRLQGLGPAA